MSTIDNQQTIRELIANHGYFHDDPRVAFIVEYTNAWGGTCWGITYVTESYAQQRRYLEASSYVINPRLLWSAKIDSEQALRDFDLGVR